MFSKTLGTKDIIGYYCNPRINQGVNVTVWVVLYKGPNKKLHFKKFRRAKMKIGFVGLGQMGAPMALNLMQEYDVLIFDKSKDAMLRIAQHETRIISKPRQVVDIDLLILCLPTAEDIKDVLFSSQISLANYLKKGAIVVDTGTTGYTETLEICGKLNSNGQWFLDAPVSGMRSRAKTGSLTMMVGGEKQFLEKVKNPLSLLASKILHMGATGTGQLTKLINNLLFDINAAALAEILPMSIKLGIDSEQIGEIINSGTGRSYASEFFIPNILKGNFSNGYPMQEAYKDLINGAKISADRKIPAPVLAAATSTYKQALLEGHGDKDKGGMIMVYERLLKVSFRA